ncbi:MAG TPA: pyridoxamine 5'-phosphate oxidase family protein [Anaerolineae bacterium]|nr:pyridoxamine 5'-phosphate oxidase family protein [Anaerolineae bacterium]
MIEANDKQRLETAANIWLATVRPNGSPHLVPIWFVWLDEKAFICTGRDSIKARNIAKNSHVAFSLEDGSDPLVVQGEARFLDTIPSAVADAFQKKYDWNIIGNETYNALIEITPTRVFG